MWCRLSRGLHVIAPPTSPASPTPTGEGPYELCCRGPTWLRGNVKPACGVAPATAGAQRACKPSLQAAHAPSAAQLAHSSTPRLSLEQVASQLQGRCQPLLMTACSSPHPLGATAAQHRHRQQREHAAARHHSGASKLPFAVGAAGASMAALLARRALAPCAAPLQPCSGAARSSQPASFHSPPALRFPFSPACIPFRRKRNPPPCTMPALPLACPANPSGQMRRCCATLAAWAARIWARNRTQHIEK